MVRAHIQTETSAMDAIGFSKREHQQNYAIANGAET